jgi:prepilin-type N-terminal cleavage/methylation domain-containing protein
MIAINRNQKGFTLGELLVVIAIMTILVGVAVGSFTGLIASGKSEAASFEKMAVQTAVDAHMGVSASATVTARSTAAVIASSDSDAPFTNYLRRLPTTYEYTWLASGSVTQYGAPAGAGGGGAGAGGGGTGLPTPIARWHLDEGSGVSAEDSIGSNHGTIFNATWTTDGVSGNALRLNTTDDDDYVVINPFSGFPSSEITVEFWMRSSDTSRNGSPISYCSAGHNNDFLIYNYNSYSVYVDGDNVNTGISPNDGSWHHIAVTWRSSDGQTKLYRDGQPVYTGAMLPAGTVITPGGALVFGQEQDSIGGGFAASQAFEGDIDEIVIYDQVLEDSEILADFNSY